MYNDHISYLVNGWWDFYKHGITLKSLSNKDNTPNEFSEFLICVWFISPLILHWSLWEEYSIKISLKEIFSYNYLGRKLYTLYLSKYQIKLFIYRLDFQEIRFFLFLPRRADNSLQKFYVQKGQLLLLCYSCKYGLPKAPVTPDRAILKSCDYGQKIEIRPVDTIFTGDHVLRLLCDRL
jgi:hypothetical protein